VCHELRLCFAALVVLEPYRGTLNGRERAFTEDAIKEIVKTNWAVDDPPSDAWKNPPG
jgi:hypothetical protein